MDEKVFVLLVLLKEMRSPAESDILSFFRFWCKLGGLGVSPRLGCLIQGV